MGSAAEDQPLLAPGFKLMKAMRKVDEDFLIMCSAPEKLFSLSHPSFYLILAKTHPTQYLPAHLSTPQRRIHFSAIARPDVSPLVIPDSSSHDSTLSEHLFPFLLPVFFYPHLSSSPFLPHPGLENEHKALRPAVFCTQVENTGIILHNLQMKMA